MYINCKIILPIYNVCAMSIIINCLIGIINYKISLITLRSDGLTVTIFITLSFKYLIKDLPHEWHCSVHHPSLFNNIWWKLINGKDL